MNRLKQAWEDFTAWPRWFWRVLKFLAEGLFFYDVMIPDRPFSITGKRLKDVVWQKSQQLGLPFRECDPVWPGIKACFKAYATAKQGARDYNRLMKRLGPLFEAHRQGEETFKEFLGRLPRLLELAQIGRQARQEREQRQSADKAGDMD